MQRRSKQSTSFQTCKCKSISIAASHVIPAEHHSLLTSSIPSHLSDIPVHIQHQSHHASQRFQDCQSFRSSQESQCTSCGKGRYKRSRRLLCSLQIRQRCTSSRILRRTKTAKFELTHKLSGSCCKKERNCEGQEGQFDSQSRYRRARRGRGRGRRACRNQ
jgi:hypothetical protein